MSIVVGYMRNHQYTNSGWGLTAITRPNRVYVQLSEVGEPKLEESPEACIIVYIQTTYKYGVPTYMAGPRRELLLFGSSGQYGKVQRFLRETVTVSTRFE